MEAFIANVKGIKEGEMFPACEKEKTMEMKKMKTLCVVLMGLVASPMVSHAGAGSSGGGDAVAAEFTRIAHQISQLVERQPVAEVSGKDFKEGVLGTLVRTQDKVFHNGMEVDAINIPSEKKIVVSRSRWSDLKAQKRMKYVLVFHEYLGVLGIDDSSYQISKALFGKVDRIADFTCNSFKLINSQSSGQKYFLKVSMLGDLSTVEIVDQNSTPVESFLSSSAGFVTMALDGTPPATGAEQWAIDNMALYVHHSKGALYRALRIKGIIGLLSEKSKVGTVPATLWMFTTPNTAPISETEVNCNYITY